MRRKPYKYLAIPICIGIFFWNKYFLVVAIPAGILYFLHTKGVFRLLRKYYHRRKTAVVTSNDIPVPQVEEPTMITVLSRAPNELLGVGEDAGTSTIIQSFYRQVKEEQNDALRLNKHGRRLTVAKNEMLSRRRKGLRSDSSSTSAQRDLKKSLQSLLEARPVYSGKVIQFTTLNPSLVEKFVVGAEIEDLGLTGLCGDTGNPGGRGNTRFVIKSKSGRLLSTSGDGQVVFLPGTRFIITSRKAWLNPDDPGSPAGFTYELEEVA